MSLATSALRLTGSSSVKKATCDDDYGELLLDVGSVCAPDQGPQNPRLNVQKKGIEIILKIMDVKDRFIVYTRRGSVRTSCTCPLCS